MQRYWVNLIVLPILVALVGGNLPGQEDHRPETRQVQSPATRQLVSNYNTTYQQFVESFRKSEDDAERLKLVKQASDDLNGLLAPQLKEPMMADVLPRLVTSQLVDLQPTFVEVIDGHPDPQVRALALLCFGKYSGNNDRGETCEATLDYLKKRYGRLPYRGATFADAADESLYYFQNLAVGCEAPPTVGEDADGAVFRLSDYRGKVVMLRFWGNWCPACRRMYGYERKLVEKFKNRPFALVGVNSDSREECQRAQRHSNLMWRSIWDGGTTHGPVASMYRVGKWPTIIVIDAAGKIRFRAQGLNEEQLGGIIERLVAEAATSEQPAENGSAENGPAQNVSTPLPTASADRQ
jgi:peroxiredoxin